MLQNTLENTIARIREEELPCWDLYYYTDKWGTSKQPYGNYFEKDIEGSVTKLNATVKSVLNPETMKWHIVLRSTKNSNQDKKFPFDFVLKATENAAPVDIQQPQPQFGGLGALEMHNNYLAQRTGDLGALQQRLYTKEDNLADRERTLAKDETTLAIKQNQLEVDRRVFDEKKAKIETELKDLEKKYKDNTEAAKEAFGMLVMKALKTFGENGDLSGLAGTDNDDDGANDTPEQAEARALFEGLVKIGLPLEKLKEITTFTATVAVNAQNNGLDKGEIGQIIAPAFMKMKEIVEAKGK